MEKTVVAVVGCGRIARNAHFPAFAKMDNIRVKYACDILLDKADKMKEDFPFIEQTITDYKQALADSEVEAVFVLTPNDMHYTVAMDALAAGKHVLCEKPLAVTAAQAAELALLAEQSGRICGTVFNNRWLAPLLRAAQLADEGRLGRVLHFHASYLHNSCIDPDRRVGWKQDREICGGGVLFDLGSHVIDLMSRLCGRITAVSGHSQIAYPTHLDAQGRTWQTNADEAFYLLAVTENGARGTIEVSKLTQGANDDLSFEIYGERGSLKFSLMEPNLLRFYDATTDSKPIGGNRGYTAIECVGRYPDMIFPSPKAPAGWLYGHLEGMKSYLSAVAENRPFAPSFADGAYVQAVMEAAYRSDAEGGRLTEVPPC